MKFKKFSAIAAAIAVISCCAVAAQAVDYTAASYADNNPSTCSIVKTDENGVTVAQVKESDFVKCRLVFGDIVSSEEDCAKIASGSFKVTYNGLLEKQVDYMGGAAYVSAKSGNSTEWKLSADGSTDTVSFESTWSCTPGAAKMDGEIVFMDWAKNDYKGEGITITFSDIKVFDKDGNEIATKPYGGVAAAEETTAAETEAPVEEVVEEDVPEEVDTDADVEEVTDEEVDEEIDDDLDEEIDDDLDELLDDLLSDDDEEEEEEEYEDGEFADAAHDDGGTIGWDQYDFEAMKAMNEKFELGGKLDLVALLGEGWDKFTTIEADFTWTPGEKWCGGAGIGAAVNCNGDTWIMGDEFGAANANEAVAPDGKATQTILKMDAPLQEIASVDDKGNWSFGELQVQNWWNGKEAGAKVVALRFLDASGNIIVEAKFGAEEEAAAPVEEAPVEEAPVATTGDVAAATDSSKGSPDTGVADVAAVAGLAIVAAGAVIVAKKRK